MSGQDDVARLQLRIDRPPFNRWREFKAVSVDAELRAIRTSVPFQPKFSHHPKQDLLQCGGPAALVDAAGDDCPAVLHGAPAPPASPQIDYLAPAGGDDVGTRGLVRNFARSLSCAGVELRCASGLIAIARGTSSTLERQ